MVRYYCDRCNAEVESPDDLIEIAIEGRERPNYAAWNLRSELCRTCFEAAREQLTAALGTGDETKRRSVRRAAG